MSFYIVIPPSLDITKHLYCCKQTLEHYLSPDPVVTLPRPLSLVICALIALSISDVGALKEVVLTIQPRVVERWGHATLGCSYDLEGASLYYVKWYRGTFEFYRFTPSEEPSTKLFLNEAIKVDVSFGKLRLFLDYFVIFQVDHSNATQVVLIDIDFQLSGNFSCEVTTAEEPASTGTGFQAMMVVRK